MNEVARLLQRFAWWWTGPRNAIADPVSADEIGAAVRVLYGIRPAVRKRQRKRRHVTYKQRDHIAWLLLRLQSERRFTAMNRAEWISYFKEYVENLSDFHPEEIEDAAEQAADEQQQQTGTDDASLWQTPGAAGAETMRDWNTQENEAAEAMQEDATAQTTPREPGDDDDTTPPTRYPDDDTPRQPGSPTDPNNPEPGKPPEERESPVEVTKE